ncbi:MAG: hypothetical protein ACR2QW_15770, partial [bacterium]
ISPAPRGGTDLAPYVVVADIDKVRSINWSAVRADGGMNYTSRWDDLTLLDACLWIPPDELREAFGIEGRVTARYTDGQCKFWVHSTDANREAMREHSRADSTVLLQILVELHESTEWPGRIENNYRTDRVIKMQYSPFEAGASDLKVYAHHKTKHLYVFPQGGRTLWRMAYLPPGAERDVFYNPTGQPGQADNIGLRYMQLLVEKYGGQL